MRVAIIYDPGGPDWTPADVKSVLDPVRDTSQILRELGHEVVEVPTRRDLRWFDTCRTADLVFNFCESVEGVSLEEEWVAAALELSGIPFTGCGAWTIAACHRKDVTNACLQSAELPIPAWFVSRGGAIPEDMTLPVIVKPNAEDASAGIDGQASVCTTPAELEQRIATQAVYFDELLIQRYVGGRECNVGFVGDHTLPISEIDYSNLPEGHWPILSYRAKWDVGSEEDRGSQPVCPAPLEPDVAARILDVSRRAWEAMEGHGYGRVDLRLDEAGHPWIIEVNPNPDISEDAGLPRMAAAMGWPYVQLIRAIVDAALQRARQRREADARRLAAANPAAGSVIP